MARVIIIMGSFCPVCNQFVNSLDDCELPYGGAPAPNYYEEYEPSSPTYFEPEPIPIAKRTRSNTFQSRQTNVCFEVRQLLNNHIYISGIENQLANIEKIFIHLKKNFSVLKANPSLFEITKSKIDEFIRDHPQAKYLQTIRYQLFEETKKF